MWRRTLSDPWLVGICLSRLLLYTSYLVVAACVPVLRQDWGLSATEAGTLIAAFTAAYTISLATCSGLCDWVGARAVVRWSSSLSALAAVAFGAFARDYGEALVFYTILGIALGGTYTSVLILISQRYEMARRGRAIGWLIAATSLAFAASLGLSALGLWLGGYQAAFWLTALPTVPGAVLTLAILRSEAAATPSPSALATSPVRPAPPAPPAAPALGREDRRNQAWLIASYIAHTWELVGFWSWGPAFLAACFVFAGAGNLAAAGQGAFVGAIMHLIGALAAFVMGGLSDRLGRRRVILAMALSSGALGMLLGWLTFAPVWLTVLLAIALSFAAIGDSPVLSTALTEVTAPERLGRTLAVRSLLGFGAGAVAPVAFGWVLDLSNPGAGTPVLWGWAMMSLGGAGLIAAACAWRTRLPAPFPRTRDLG